MILRILLFLMVMNSPLTFDFGKSDSSTEWFSVNDSVMGGLSEGSVSYTKKSMLFKGQLSLENNGGFASVRSQTSMMDLSELQTLEIRCRGYGGTFEITMARHQEWYLPNYKHAFTPDEDWSIIQLPIRDFKEFRIGEPTGSKLNKELSASIIRMGIIKGDKKTEPFQLEVDYIVLK